MSIQSQTAEKCFRENKPALNTAVPSLNDPAALEKWNLYNGLANLAEAVGQLEQQVAAIQQAVAQLRRP